MKNILIYRTGSLGDTIVSLASIQLIKNLNPDNKIFFFSIKNEDPNSVSPIEIIKDLNIINEYIELNNITSLKSFFETLRILGKYKFEKIYYLNEDRPLRKKIRDFIFFRVFLNYKIIGLNLFSQNNNLYEGFYLINKIKKTSFNEFDNLNKIIRKKIKSKIGLYNYFNVKNYITISPGGRIPSKRWNINNWKIFINKIITQNKNVKIVILGTKSDMNQNSLISKLNKNNIINLTGKTSISDLKHILNFSNMHICHDDGTMHLAMLLNKKVISLFHNLNFKEKWFQGHNKNYIQLYSSRGINKVKINQVMSKFKEIK